MDMVTPLAQAVLDAAPTVTIAGHRLRAGRPSVRHAAGGQRLAATALVVITPDEPWEALRAEGCIPDTQYLNVMYADNGKTAGENDAALDDIVAALQPRDMGGFEKGAQGARRPLREPLVAGHAHSHGERNALPVCRLRLMITYLALYIGFVFLISTAPFWPSSSSPKRPIRHRATASCGSSAATEA